MDDPFLVRCFEPVGDLDEERDGLIDCQGNAFSKSLTLDQPHHQKLFAFVLLETIQSGYVRVVQLRQKVS